MSRNESPCLGRGAGLAMTVWETMPRRESGLRFAAVKAIYHEPQTTFAAIQGRKLGGFLGRFECRNPWTFSSGPRMAKSLEGMTA